MHAVRPGYGWPREAASGTMTVVTVATRMSPEEVAEVVDWVVAAGAIYQVNEGGPSTPLSLGGHESTETWTSSST